MRPAAGRAERGRRRRASRPLPRCARFSLSSLSSRLQACPCDITTHTMISAERFPAACKGVRPACLHRACFCTPLAGAALGVSVEMRVLALVDPTHGTASRQTLAAVRPLGWHGVLLAPGLVQVQHHKLPPAAVLPFPTPTSLGQVNEHMRKVLPDTWAAKLLEDGGELLELHADLYRELGDGEALPEQATTAGARQQWMARPTFRLTLPYRAPSAGSPVRAAPRPCASAAPDARAWPPLVVLSLRRRRVGPAAAAHGPGGAGRARRGLAARHGAQGERL